jgi:membrane protein DedA with SNARE-associated domain
VHWIDSWLPGLPPPLVYLLLGLVVGGESMGIPLPGELTLMSAALLAASGCLRDRHRSDRR